MDISEPAADPEALLQDLLGSISAGMECSARLHPTPKLRPRRIYMLPACMCCVGLAWAAPGLSRPNRGTRPQKFTRRSHTVAQLHGRTVGIRRHHRGRTVARAIEPLAMAASQAATLDLPQFQYAFMFPVAIMVATSCQLAGIGGAALFSPIFLLIFPLLGPEYVLESSGQAIASALLTEVFGFASGLSGYLRRGLVDGSTAMQFIVFSAPSALVGAFCLSAVASNTQLLRAVYALLMLGLSAFLAVSPTESELARNAEEECEISPGDTRSLAAADGRVFEYRALQQSVAGNGATVFGGFLTGLLGVGVGEVVLPQLLQGCCMPMPVASGTSVATVVATAAAAALVQFANLAESSGGNVLECVPLRLVAFTIPGVLIGGQIAPALAGKLPDAVIQRVAAFVFLIVGLSFLIAAVQV